FPLFEPPGGVRQRRVNIFRLEVGVRFENAFTRFTAGQKPENGADRDAQPADARLPAHDGGVVGDSLDLHVASPFRRVLPRSTTPIGRNRCLSILRRTCSARRCRSGRGASYAPFFSLLLCRPARYAPLPFGPACSTVLD